MSPFVIMVSLAAAAIIAAGVAIALWNARANLERRVQRLNFEMLEASKDASVGRRLTVPNDPATSQLAESGTFFWINTLPCSNALMSSQQFEAQPIVT